MKSSSPGSASGMRCLMLVLLGTSTSYCSEGAVVPPGVVPPPSPALPPPPPPLLLLPPPVPVALGTAARSYSCLPFV